MFTFTTETWADASDREFCRPPDRLVQAAIASPDVRRLLVANPWRSAPLSLLRRTEVAPPSRGTLVQPFRLRRRDPTDLKGVVGSYRRYDQRLRRAALRAGLQEPAVLTCHPLVAGFAPLTWAGPVTYFARDDWTAHPQHRAWWPVYREAYRRMAERGVRVAAVSQVLLDRLAATGPSLVVPNGVSNLFGSPGPAPAVVQALARPRYVYAGTLDDRLDLPAVRALAASLTEGSVLLVGPQPRPLPELPGVTVLPTMNQADLVATLAACDVGLVPHHVTPLTEAMSPLKLYEYLAAGLPVATVALGAQDPAPGRLVRYPGQTPDLPAAAAAARALGPRDEPSRRAFLTEHGWPGRTAAVLDLALAHG